MASISSRRWVLGARGGVGIAGALALAASAGGATTVVYNGALNTLPQSQGWVVFLPPFGTGGGTQTQVATPPGYVTLDSSNANANRGGYFSHFSLFSSIPPSAVNGAWPVLNASTGYSVRFDLRVVSETHATSHRAGVSVISLSSAGPGIELGIWEDRVWAQAGGVPPVLFTQSEGAWCDTGDVFRRYDLNMQSGVYTLYVDGVRVLSGPMRDYSAWDSSGSGLPFNPYRINNFLFIGDNTSSASARADIARIEVRTTPIEFPQRCSPADIADDSGQPLGSPLLPALGTNNGVTEGDYNAFFSGYFDAMGYCDIADDAGQALPPFTAGAPGVNNGVTEGDYNVFFSVYFDGCP
ncbi:MAG: hypothetical protein K2X32_06175 [Phycisphaerales bacterium]|nr:hypothetical protein [Phycisphaerales bacterium]